VQISKIKEIEDANFSNDFSEKENSFQLKNLIKKISAYHQ
jgi:hypothetical protein